MSESSSLSCPACESKKCLTFGVKYDYPLWRCASCRTLFAKIEESKEIGELYDQYYQQAGFDLPPTAAASLTRLVRECETYRQTGRWLDIGYGEGGLLRIVESYGWRCYGTELSPQALAFGQARGWIVSKDVERDERFPESRFDVVTMIEFVEHSLDPESILAIASRLLRPGGLLYLTTPNAGSLNRRLLGIDWSVISPPEHLTIWSSAGLSSALLRTGFQVVRMRAEGMNPGELMQRWKKQDIGTSATPSRNEVAFTLNQKLMASPTRRLLKRTINQALSVCGVGDTLKAWAVKGVVKK